MISRKEQETVPTREAVDFTIKAKFTRSSSCNSQLIKANLTTTFTTSVAGNIQITHQIGN